MQDNADCQQWPHYLSRVELRCVHIAYSISALIIWSTGEGCTGVLHINGRATSPVVFVEAETWWPEAFGNTGPGLLGPVVGVCASRTYCKCTNITTASTQCKLGIETYIHVNVCKPAERDWCLCAWWDS